MFTEDDLRRGMHRTVAEAPPPVPTGATTVRAARRHRQTVGVAAAAVVVAVAAGVPAVLARGATDPVRPDPAVAPAASASAIPFDLNTHCGIRYAKFAGRWWQAVPPRPDVTPGTGPGGVYTRGTMTLISADEARFDSTDPVLTARFVPLTTGSPEPCD
ncbi:hypothetical protein ACWKSP_37080 [Micromonosporaceae bacterium Da 78-11]